MCNFMSDKMTSGQVILLLILTGCCSLAIIGGGNVVSAAELEEAKSNGGAANDWLALKDSLSENKKSMCSFLIFQVSDKEVELTIERVADLFEQALDHLSKATQYTQLMRPYIDAGVITEYDDNGRRFVLEISETRRSLLAEYNRARNNEELRGQILEKYFYKACESKLGTVVAENTMYKSLLKVERLMKRKLRMPDYYGASEQQQQQQQQQ